LRQLGPGLIIAGSIVGSGELIVTTGLGAKAGFILLWLIVLGCVVKVFVQVELGRYAISEGATTLEAMNRMPGPRGVVSWLVWLWLLMYLCTCVQLAGILGGCAQVISCLGSSWSEALLAAVVAAPSALLLASGRYVFMERLSTTLVFLFTTCTVLAVVMLQWTPYAMSLDDVLAGMEFRLPPAQNFVWAFAAFGITGVGASELIYYPYWCLEKGYARYVGPRDDSPAWAERARGWIRVMQVDAWVSLGVYTVATAAFYFLGAAVLHAKGVEVTDQNLIPDLSHMYRETLGAPGLWIFLVGAFFVLASTFLVANASNARLFADALPILRILRYSSDSRRVLVVRLACLGLPAFNLLLFVYLETPVSLVFVGALGQAVMLPLLAALALYLRYGRTDVRLRPGSVWTLLLWVAFLSMAAIGIYQACSKIWG
jgi:Mn2+/Fe2+ NRAMP family transporter